MTTGNWYLDLWLEVEQAAGDAADEQGEAESDTDPTPTN